MNHPTQVINASNAAPCSIRATKIQNCGRQRSAASLSSTRLSIRSRALQTEEITTTSTTDITPTPTSTEDRKYLSLLPPFFSRSTACSQLSDSGLWSLTQPLKPPGQADIRLRMVASRLDDGNLLLIGPVAPTQEVLNQLKALGGAVTHVIVPNTSPEHWLYAPALAAALPNATFWFCPGFFEGKGVPLPGRSLLFRAQRARGQCSILGVDPFPAELEGQVRTVLFNVPFFLEAAIVLPRHKVLLLADTGICLSASDPEYSTGKVQVKLAETIGVWDRLGPITRVVFEQYKEQGKEWVEKVLDEDFETVVPAHGSAPLRDGKTAFKNCFDFLF
jgi:hypothetical protein